MTITEQEPKRKEDLEQICRLMDRLDALLEGEEKRELDGQRQRASLRIRKETDLRPTTRSYELCRRYQLGVAYSVAPIDYIRLIGFEMDIFPEEEDRPDNPADIKIRVYSKGVHDVEPRDILQEKIYTWKEDGRMWGYSVTAAENEAAALIQREQLAIIGFPESSMLPGKVNILTVVDDLVSWFEEQAGRGQISKPYSASRSLAPVAIK